MQEDLIRFFVEIALVQQKSIQQVQQQQQM